VGLHAWIASQRWLTVPSGKPEVGFDSQWLHEEMQEESGKTYHMAMIDVKGGDAEQCNYFVYEHFYQKFVP